MENFSFFYINRKDTYRLPFIKTSNFKPIPGHIVELIENVLKKLTHVIISENLIICKYGWKIQLAVYRDIIVAGYWQ